MVYKKVLDIIDELARNKIWFRLSSDIRPRSLAIEASLPGEKWEIEVFENGSVECERFVSEGTIHGEQWLIDAIERVKD